ncbi:MAG: hypothetical protein AABW83_04510 [Nanoarchaeota archaeon]
MESINLIDIYNKLKEIEINMATKEELAKAIETISILSNEETIEQIDSSNNDIKKGRFKIIKSAQDI